MGKYFKYAIGEILLVVIGILIALQINNWNETKKITEAAEKTIERIQKEIQSNQAQINNVYDYHIMVKDTIGKISKPKTEEEATNALRFWRGLRIFRLKDAAFQTAIQSGIAKDIDANLMEELNTLYTNQESYNEFSKTASQSLYSKDFTKLENFTNIVIFLNMTMIDLYYYETELKQQFETCLTQIDSIYKK